jgi:hypothetical protein
MIPYDEKGRCGRKRSWSYTISQKIEENQANSGIVLIWPINTIDWDGD